MFVIEICQSGQVVLTCDGWRGNNNRAIPASPPRIKALSRSRIPSSGRTVN